MGVHVALECLLMIGVLSVNIAGVPVPQELTAASAQRLAYSVDAAAAMATSTEQLAGTRRSLKIAGRGKNVGGLIFVKNATQADAEDTILSSPLRTLGELNGALRNLLRRLRDELGALFTSGRSEGLRPVLRELAGFPQTHAADLRSAVDAVPEWARRCRAPGASARYDTFQSLHAELRALDADIRGLSNKIFVLREQRATMDGTLAGFEEKLGIRRGRRRGEEYELARYLGSSLFRWDLLRMKVTHHLAFTFTAAHEAVSERVDSSQLADAAGAEAKFNGVEGDLEKVSQRHKELSQQRNDKAKQLRAFLKSLLLSCDAASNEASTAEAGMSKRFQVLRSSRLGVAVQAAEEFTRFLNVTFVHSLPQTVALLEEVLEPYESSDAVLVLPTTWKAKPKIGRWWEWLEESGSTTVPLGLDEFERRFAAAKRRFSVRVSAGEPVVMAYILWTLLEQTLGAKVQEILALPSPQDASAGTTARSNSSATVNHSISDDLPTFEHSGTATI